MLRRSALALIAATLSPFRRSLAELVPASIKVSLPEAHRGTLEIDTQLMDSYGRLPDNIRQFYLDAREIFASNSTANFSNSEIVAAAQRHGLDLMAGPMLGDLRPQGVTIWLRTAIEGSLTVQVGDKSLTIDQLQPGQERRVRIDGLTPNSEYAYAVLGQEGELAGGRFSTPPSPDEPSKLRIAFGSCFHKIGLHNPNLFREVLNRRPHAMLLLGDIAVDDRNNNVSMHRSDYQLRDVSKPWRSMVSNLPVYAAWDDHDYFDNDLSGIPRTFNAQDRNAVREVWHQNWNNPPTENNREGIYFNTRLGPVEVIMLDTRSCRNNQRRGAYGSYLGEGQMNWLKTTLKSTQAPFKIISSGTMWSDFVSNGKDSWGTWDKEGREEILNFIEQQKIGGVLFISGDRHGARGFRMPRPSGFTFHEFEPATLGGVSGPKGIIKNCTEQLFGHDGQDFIAFGEFSFDTTLEEPKVTFRLIHHSGDVLEEIELSLRELTPAD